MSLEEAITQACRFGVPKPESLDRMLRALFKRMATNFFPHSHLEAAAVYLHADRPPLAELVERYDESKPPLNKPDHEHDLNRRQHRRETLALLATEHEQFADPIDLLARLAMIAQPCDPFSACSIITTTANAVVRPIHDRMPVILDPADYGQWLDPRAGADDLAALLRPFPENAMTTFPVSSYVSNASNQGPQCIQSNPINASSSALP